MARNLPINSVYGDTGSVEATYTKDLNTIGNDPYVRVVANSGEFNLFQQMNLSDNFYDSRFEEVYVTQNSAGTGNALSLASLQFNTMGWTRVDRMYLEIPIVFNYIISNNWHTFNVDPALDSHLQAGNRGDRTLSLISNIQESYGNKTTKLVADMTQVDFALMEVFNRIQVFAGNNNQPIGRTQSFFKEGMKTQLREVPWNNNTIKILSNWGLPVAHLSTTNSATPSEDYNTANIDSLNAVNLDGYHNLDMDCVPQDWIKNWAKLFLYLETMFCGQGVGLQNIDGNNSQYQQAQLNIPLPLSYINNFFRHKTYLPPDFKLKIDIEGVPQVLGQPINYNCPLILINNLNQYNPRLTSNRTEEPSCFGFSAGINFSGIKLVYQNHTLRQPIQAQINEKWLAYPIVYNYETFETYDVDNSGNNTTTMIVRDIAISQQRPTQLIFQIIDSVTQCPDLRGNWAVGLNAAEAWNLQANPLNYPYQFNPRNNNTVDANNAPHGTAQIGSSPWCTDLACGVACTVVGALSNKGRPANLININTPAQTKNPNFPIITSISTLIGGRTQYYYKNDNTPLNVNFAPPNMNAYDCLISETDAECYKDYSTETNVLKTPIAYTSLGNSGVYQRLVIAPGGYVNTADIPTDLGASVIRVQVTLNRPLPTTKKLQIVKKMPEQIAVDTNKNCTLIMWPAIKSNNGFAIPNVVNTQ